jgi:flagellar protein FliO/FliZ
MNFFDAIRALTALIFVLGLILGLTWLLRRFGSRIGIRAGLSPSDLRVVEWKQLDVRRKLAVVRWDGRDHLLCLGPSSDFVVAERAAPPEPAKAGDGDTP